MNSLKLKIGLDYHGVIDQKPDCFSLFCHQARKRGHLIYIITGGPITKVKHYLKDINVEYDFIFAIYDYYQTLGDYIETKDGKIEIPDEKWNIAKAKFCSQNKIDIHIDDSKEYLQWFTTPFCLYDKQSNICTIKSKVTLDFNDDPYKVINQIEQILSK